MTVATLEAHVPLCPSRVTSQPQAAPEAGPCPARAASGSTAVPRTTLHAKANSILLGKTGVTTTSLSL